MKKVLLTSICRPLGERYGDASSVGYELLFGQVTRAQGLFSPRANHIQYSLEYVAENLDAPTTVLHYPSKQELIQELKKGYDMVGVSFLLATFHRMKEVVELVRRHSPKSQIVLGGYGTVIADELLLKYGDHICREEGVAYMRRLLGEPEIAMPYRHPLIVSRLRIFGKEISRTGMVFAGLGCPNGCDFCCTSYFFKRRHIKLLPTGRDLYKLIMQYHKLEPGMGIVVLDEDFLLNRKRTLEFRDCVIEGGVPLSLFAFASVRALSMYGVEELLEMGLDGLWIGYESKESQYAKQSGRDVGELFRELQEHGISILASMIIGFPHQTPEIIDRELSTLLKLKPAFSQFLIYGPTPGTPFYLQVIKEGLLDPRLLVDNERYYRNCTGFTAMVKHPLMNAETIEAAQHHCFEEDYRQLGPSIFRRIETWLLGYLKNRNSPNPMLRKKSQLFARYLQGSQAVFKAGRIFAPNPQIRKWIAELEIRVRDAVGHPNMTHRLASVAAVGLAAWTGLTLKLGIFQHPSLVRHTFRMPEEALPAKVWRLVNSHDPGGHQVQVELRPEKTVWVHVKGTLNQAGAGRLAEELSRALSKRQERLVLDFKHLAAIEEEAAGKIIQLLQQYRDRIRLALPDAGTFAALTVIFEVY